LSDIFRYPQKADPGCFLLHSAKRSIHFKITNVPGRSYQNGDENARDTYVPWYSLFEDGHNGHS